MAPQTPDGRGRGDPAAAEGPEEHKGLVRRAALRHGIA